MKCPLLAIAWAGVVAKQEENYPDCLEEECAWFDENTGACSVLSLARVLTAIGDVLGRMHDKMPTRIQFLK